MQKTLIASIAAVVIIVGAGFVLSDMINRECLKNYDDGQLAFKYPCTWEVTKSDKQEHLVFVELEDSNNVYMITYPAKSFAEQDLDQKLEIEDGYVSVEELSVTIDEETYTARRYSEHGGTRLLIDVNGMYLSVSRADDMVDQEDLDRLQVVLESLTD